MLTIELALRRGASGVLVAGCGVDPACRTGADHTQGRLAGDHEPSLRTDRIDSDKVTFVRYDRTDPQGLIDAAQAFRKGQKVTRFRRTTSRLRRSAVATIIILSLSASTLYLSDGPYRTVRMEKAAFVVSLKHAGDIVKSTQNVDDSNVLPHMRRQRPIERVRVGVRLRVTIDDSLYVQNVYDPGGLFNDGLSIGISELGIEPGRHSIVVEIDNTEDTSRWTHSWTSNLDFVAAERRILVFDEDGRFILH